MGNGDGTFQAVLSYQGGNFPTDVDTGDFNGDGVLDLAVADFSGQRSVNVLLANVKDGVAPLLDFSLSTQADARQALPEFQRKLDQIAAQRGEVGAFEARLSTALATTKVASDNFAAAESQIVDADVAEEAARLVRNQILQQAGVAILGQANQGPALALALLG